MGNALEGLLAFTAGGVSKAAKQVRENELLEIDRKEADQERRTKRLSEINQSLITLFGTGQFDPESLQFALSQVPQLIQQGEGEAAVQLLQVKEKPKPGEGPPTAREKFEALEIQRAATLKQAETREKRLSASKPSNIKTKALQGRADDLRSEISLLERQKRERDEFNVGFAKSPLERKRIQKQIDAKGKELKNINKSISKTTGIKVEEPEPVTLEDFAGKREEISIGAQSPNPNTKLGAMKELAKFSSRDEGLRFILNLALEKRITPDTARQLKEMFVRFAK